MIKIRYFINVLCFKNFLWTTLCTIFISTFLNFESVLILLLFLRYFIVKIEKNKNYSTLFECNFCFFIIFFKVCKNSSNIQSKMCFSNVLYRKIKQLIDFFFTNLQILVQLESK